MSIESFMSRLLKKYEMATDLITEILKEYVEVDPKKATEFLEKAQKIIDEK